VDDPADRFRCPFDVLDLRPVRVAGVEELPRRAAGRGGGDGGAGGLQRGLGGVEVVVDDDDRRGVAVSRAFLGRSRDDQEVPDGGEGDLVERRPQVGLLAGQLLQQRQRLVEVVGPEACVRLQDGHHCAPVVSSGYWETAGEQVLTWKNTLLGVPGTGTEPGSAPRPLSYPAASPAAGR